MSGRRRRRVLLRAGGTGRRRRTSGRPARSARCRSRRRCGRRPPTAAPSRSRRRAAGDPRAGGRSCPGTRSEPARAPISAIALGTPPPRGARASAGVGTPSLAPARTTDPVIASSSVGPPDAASRAAEVVRSSGMASMIAHWAAAVELDTVGGRHRARLARAPPRGERAMSHRARSGPTARPLATVAAASTASRAAFSQRTARSPSPTDDLDPGNAERLERGVERRSVELARRGGDDGVPGRALDDDSRLGREAPPPARCSRRRDDCVARSGAARGSPRRARGR